MAASRPTINYDNLLDNYRSRILVLEKTLDNHQSRILVLENESRTYYRTLDYLGTRILKFDPSGHKTSRASPASRKLATRQSTMTFMKGRDKKKRQMKKKTRKRSRRKNKSNRKKR